MSFFLFYFFFIVIKCQVKKGSSMNNNNRNLQNVEFTNIRLEYDVTCLYRTPTTNVILDVLEEEINKARQTIQKLVMVQKYSETLSLKNYNFPDEFYSCSNNNLIVYLYNNISNIIKI